MKKPRKAKNVAVQPHKPMPGSLAKGEATTIVDQRLPSHEFRLVAEIAARLLPVGREVNRQQGASAARSALNLLDGVRDMVANREEARSTILKGLSNRLDIPEHLGWAAGKKFILGSDGGGSDERFGQLLKDKLRIDKYFLLRSQRLNAGKPEPELSEVPVTTARELNSLVKRFENDGFTRMDLETLHAYFLSWRKSVDGRRKKK